MPKAKYKTITFAEGFDMPFANFKETFKGLEIFRMMKPEIREKELKKAHKIATAQARKAKAQAKKDKANGHSNSSAKKSGSD